VRFLYQYPDTQGTERDMLDAGPVAELARAADQTGWDGFAFTEHPVPGAKWLARGGHQTLDPFAALAHVAAVTTQLRLLTYLAVVPYRNPLLLAKTAATIDRLSNGRLILGIGTGYQKSEFHALGVDFEERNALFDEALAVLPLHWAGEPFNFRGRHFDARDSIALPRPVQRPIPIWIGGNSKLTIRRVAEKAQGWLPLTSPVDISVTTRTPSIRTLDDLAHSIRELRTQAGDRAGTIEVAAPYTDPTIAEPAHDVARHRDAFAALEDIGVTSIVVAVSPNTYPESRSFVERFAENYITY
jgi:probable F420-dependent oxidoreductase